MSSADKPISLNISKFPQNFSVSARLRCYRFNKTNMGNNTRILYSWRKFLWSWRDHRATWNGLFIFVARTRQYCWENHHSLCINTALDVIHCAWYCREIFIKKERKERKILQIVMSFLEAPVSYLKSGSFTVKYDLILNLKHF